MATTVYEREICGAAKVVAIKKYTGENSEEKLGFDETQAMHRKQMPITRSVPLT